MQTGFWWCAMARQFFRVLEQPSHTVIELFLPETLDGLEFDRFSDELWTILDAHPAHIWILDLGGVQYMGSAVLGLMVNIRQRVKDSRGQLVMCAMTPRLSDVFRMCSLERLFTIAKTRADALRRFAPAKA
jgi:anti-anti-sigma factor